MSQVINKELVREWVEALRSGEYEQGRISLKNDTGYCCLGVLCEVSDYDDWNGIRSMLPDEVMKELFGDDYKNYEPEIKVKYKDRPPTLLSHLNDVDQLDFNEIANVIEQNFLKDET